MTSLLVFLMLCLAWAAFLTGSVALAAFIQRFLDRRKDRPQ